MPQRNVWLDYLTVTVESAALMLSAGNVDIDDEDPVRNDYDDGGGSGGDDDDYYENDSGDFRQQKSHRRSVQAPVPPLKNVGGGYQEGRRSERRPSSAHRTRSRQESIPTAVATHASVAVLADEDDAGRAAGGADDDVHSYVASNAPSKLPPYVRSTVIEVPDERRNSTNAKQMGRKQSLAAVEHRVSIAEPPVSTTKPTERKKSRADEMPTKFKSEQRPRTVAIDSESDRREQVREQNARFYNNQQDSDEDPAQPYYKYDPAPQPPTPSRATVKAPHPPQQVSSSPDRPRKAASRSSDTTSGTTTSVTSSFSSPRDYPPPLDLDGSGHLDSMPSPSPRAERPAGSPSSIATTITNRSTSDHRHSVAVPGREQAQVVSRKQLQVPAARNADRLRSIHEAEVVDMSAPQVRDSFHLVPAMARKRASDPGFFPFAKPSSSINAVPSSSLLEALVEGEFISDHDDRSMPFEPEVVFDKDPDNVLAIAVGELPIPIVQVIDESSSRTGDHYPGGQVLVKWILDPIKITVMENRGLDISAFFLNVTGRVFGDRITSHLSFDVAPDGKFEHLNAGETLLRHQWVLPGPGKNDDDVRITKFSQKVDGLVAGEEYSVDVICEFIPSPAYTGPVFRNREVTSQSASVHFRCQGPPPPPTISVREVGIGMVTFSWSLENPDFATSYRILINGKPSKKQIARSVTESTLDGLSPGTVTRVTVIALNDYGSSRPSRELRIVCPDKPVSPEIEEQPNYSTAKSRGILIAWSGNVAATGTLSPRANISVTSYRVYVDGKLDGIVRRSDFATRHGYQYLVTNVIPGKKYEITVRAVAGEEPIDTSNNNDIPFVVSCPAISDSSNLLVCSPPSAPQSPRLRVENMSVVGIDLAWDAPSQQSLVPITGYQVLKNTRVYGTALPSEATAIRIKEVTLGETVELQLISLTDHPVGGGSITSARRSDSGVYSNHAVEQINVEKPAGSKIIVQFTRLIMPPARVWMDKITGRSAIVAWTHANVSKKQPPSHFTVATSYQITWWSIGSASSSALTQLNSASSAAAVGDVCSQSLKAAVDASEQSITLDNLKTDTAYTVVVEGRLESSYIEVIEDEIPGLEERQSRMLVLSASADPIRFATGRAPDPPQNLAVLSTTCHSILVGWDPCVEHGCEVIAIRVECSPIERDIISPHHVTMDLLPNATEALVEGLAESCDYRISVIAITQEFFDSLPANSRWKSGKTESLPKNLSELASETPWLPRAVIDCSTSGTAPASEIRVTERGEDWCKVEWNKPPRVVGTNRLVRIVVRWVRCEREGRDDQQEAIYSDDEADDFGVENRKRGSQPAGAQRLGLWSSNVEVELGEKQAVLHHLIPGTQYQIVVEAVVSVKVNITTNRSEQVDYSNRRTVHVPSKPTRFWTRCLIDPMPRLLCSSLSTTSVTVTWDRPVLTRIVGMSKSAGSQSNENDQRVASGPNSSGSVDQGRVVRMHLLGYTLVVNQTECQQLSPEVLSCTLTNCKAGTSYSIEIVAQTCIDPVFKMRMGSGPPSNVTNRNNRAANQSQSENNIDMLVPRDDIDENRFRLIHVKLPTVIPGCILSASLHLQHSPTFDRVASNASVSKIVVLWDANTTPANVVKQFSISYQCERTRQQVSKIFDSATRQYIISNIEAGTIYTVLIDSTGSSYPVSAIASKHRYNNNPVTVCLQIATPGPPETPRLIVTRRTASVLSLAWTDPKLYSGDNRRLVGFKVVLDDADYTELLPPSCHAFSLPVAVLSPARRVCVASVLTSSENASRTWTLVSNAVGLLGMFAWNNTGDGIFMDGSMAEDADRRPLPLPAEEADEQLDGFGGSSGDRIDIRAVRVDDSQIVINWNLTLGSQGQSGAEGVDVGNMIFQLTYTCTGQPMEKFVTIPAHHNTHTLSPIIPGAVYKFHVMALSSADTKTPANKRMALASSRELTVETPAPPDSPKLRLRAVNFEYVTIEWVKPKSFGNAHLTAYKVYVNSVLEITLPTNQMTFTYSRGRGCSEYTFQVQSVAGSNYASPLSEPLTLTWPGVRPPELIRYAASDEATMIRVGWEAPYATPGVSIRELFVHVVDKATRKLVHKVGPIHPDCREAEFINPFLSGLSSSVANNSADGRPGSSPAGFNIFLEVCVAGVGGGQSFWSSPLPLVHSDLPPAPAVSARLLGLDDRMRVEQRAARLINRRDSIATKLADSMVGAQQSVAPSLHERHRRHHRHSKHHNKTPRDYEQHLLSKLSDLDRKLLKILMTLDQYSGEAVVSLTVHIPMTLSPENTSPRGQITGFRIFVDGKQLKSVATASTHPAHQMSPGRSEQQQLHEVRIRLPVRRGGTLADRPHRINVACVSRSGSLGPLSSPVEVSTAPFRPFVHFCNFLAKPSLCHPPHPSASAMSSEEMFSQCRFVEVFRRDVAVRRYFANRMLPPIEVSLILDTSVFDLATRRTLFLRTLARGNRALIVALFVEASICAASSRALSMFGDFASALEGLQSHLTLIVVHHRHQSGSAPAEPQPLSARTIKSTSSGHRGRPHRHSKRAVQPAMPEVGDFDFPSSKQPAIGSPLLTTIECDVATPLTESRRTNDYTPKRLCEITRISGVPSILIVNGETECGWVGRFCALSSAEFASFINHQVNVISGAPCPTARGGNESGPGCIHCSRSEKRISKKPDMDVSSLVNGQRHGQTAADSDIMTPTTTSGTIENN